MKQSIQGYLAVLCLFFSHWLWAQTGVMYLEKNNFSSYVDLGISLSDDLLASNGLATLEFWIRSGEPGNAWTLTDLSPDATHFVLQMQNENELILKKGSNTYTMDLSGEVEHNQWHHVALTFSQGAMVAEVYVNGVKKGHFNGDFGTVSDLFFYKDVSTSLALTEIRGWGVRRAAHQLIGDQWTTYAVKTASDLSDLEASGLVTFYGHENADAVSTEELLATPELSRVSWTNLLDAGQAARVTSYQGQTANGVRTDVGHPILSLDRILLTATKGDHDDQITLEWPHIDGVSSYQVYRDGTNLNVTISAEGRKISEKISWADESILPMEVHTYRVLGLKTAGGEVEGTDDGFIFPNGVISGEIKTESEVYVDQVEVRATPKEGALPGSALTFGPGDEPVEVTGVEVFRNVPGFTLEFWLKAPGTGTGQVFNLGSFSVGFENGVLSASNGDGSAYLETSIPDDQWHHYAMRMHNSGSTLFLDGGLVDTQSQPFVQDLGIVDQFTFNSSTASATFLLDELRLWEDTLASAVIMARKNHVISGREDGLLLYYRFDLENGSYIYNQAQNTWGQYIGQSRNTLHWLPAEEQPGALAYGTFTNASGQYMIAGMAGGPTPGGVDYVIRPQKPNHEFRPAGREVLLKRSLDRADYEKTDIDFTDISALPIAGNVLYREGDDAYPVPAGQQLLMDGQVVTGASGAIETDANGTYSISAPLGLHTIAVNNAPRTRYFGNQSLYLQEASAQSDKPLSDGDAITVSGWIKRGVFTDDSPSLQSLVTLGGLNMVLKDNERLTIRDQDTDLLGAQVSLTDEFVFFALSMDKPNGMLSLVVGENYQLATGLDLSGLNVGGPLTLGDAVPKENPFTGNVDQIEYRTVYYEEAALTKIREGKLIEGDEAVLKLSYAFEETKGGRAISLTSEGFDNYLSLTDGAAFSLEYSANYTREYTYDYLASNERYNPEGGEYTLNIVDPITDLHFDNQTRFGFIGNIFVPCGNNLGAWSGEIRRTDRQGFVKDIDEENFNSDFTLFKVDGLVPGSYQVAIDNQADPQITLQSGIIDLSQGWGSADFEVRNPLEVHPALYEWDAARDTVGVLVESTCDDGTYILQAGKEYMVWVEVSESYTSGSCPVAGAEISLDGDLGVLSGGYNGQTGPEGTMGLVFAANKPNMIGDYKRALQVTATHDGRSFNTSLNAYNTGSVQENDNFTIEHPTISMVLHDPPGDGSSLSLNQSFIFSEEYNYVAGTEIGLDFGFGAGADTEVFAGLGVISKVSAFAQKIGLGTSSSFTYKTTGGNSTEYELDLSISTPADDTFTGLDADVYIGMGTVIQFGTGKTLRVANCKPQLDLNVEVARFADQTPFVYTHQDVKDVLLVQLGVLLQDAQNTGDQERVDDYQHRIDEWNRILAENEAKRANFSSLPLFDDDEEKLSEADDINLDQEFGAIEGIPENISFSGLTTQEYQFYQRRSESSGSIFGGSSGLTQETESYINGFSIGLTFKVSSSIIGLRENTSNTTNTRSGGYSFTLYDDDAGDQFNVSIKKDDAFGSPIFLTNAGQSMCPFESGTQPREGVELISDAYDVHVLSGETAAFDLTLRNTQLAVDHTPKRYFIAQDRGANPDGAVIRYNGDPLGNGLAIDFGLDGDAYTGVTQQLEGQLTITAPDHVSGDVSYENIPIIMYSGCEADGFAYLYHLDEFAEVGILPVDTVYLSAHFNAPCMEDLEVTGPTNNWVVNSRSENQMELVFKVPGLTATEAPADLTAVKVEYAPEGSNVANLLLELVTDTLQRYYDPLYDQVRYTLDVSGMADGDYQLRLSPQCGVGSEPWRSSNPTDWISGSIYRIAPIVTEVYPPENSVMTTGTISASYDRELDPTGATSLNVSLRGILGGLEYVPQSAQFNAPTDEIIVPHQEAIDLKGAYTLELWVYPSAYAGNGGKVPVLAKGENYGIYLTASGHIDNGRAISDASLVPFKWTHVAVVYDGERNVKTYFDGELVAEASHIVQYQPDTADLRIGGDAFLGRIDEVKIWSQVRATAEIITDMERRLLGNEDGLMAYYVLDDIALEGEGVRDYTGHTSGTVLTGVDWVEKSDAAPINIDKVVQDVPIDVILSGGTQVLISPKENFPEYYLEGAELTAYLSDDAIADVYGNPSTGKSWSFVINKNAVQWEQNNRLLTQTQGTATSFAMDLSNEGGTNVTYEFTDLPVWLSVVSDDGEGLLPYGFSYSIGFEVAGWINPGTHEAPVKVTVFNEDGTRAGVESFLLEVDVTCEAPSYTFDSDQYPDQVSIVGKLTVAGTPSEDVNDRVAIYLNNELRGVGAVILLNGTYRVSGEVYGYSGETGGLEFRVWDASECTEYQGIIEQYGYGSALGNLTAPIPLTTGSRVLKSMHLPAGFHWVSFNLKDAGQSVLTIQSVGGLSAGDQLSDQDGNIASYQVNGSWSGSLTELDPGQHYLLHLLADAELEFTGQEVSINTDIPVVKGTNWIGYLPKEMVSTDRSLISLGNTTAKNGDRITGREGFAEFLDGEWIGTLTHLTPNLGYRLTTAEAGVLNYYGIAGHSRSSRRPSAEAPDFRVRVSALNLGWEVKGSQFPEVMYVSGVVTGELDSDQTYLIGAFSGEACRGIAVPQRIEGKLHYFMTLYGNEKGELIQFKLVDEQSGAKYALSNTIRFEQGVLLGSYQEPYSWEVNEKAVEAPGFRFDPAYPNPFSERTTLTYQLPVPSKVKVVVMDLTGRVVKTLFNEDRPAGIHQLEWDRKDSADISVPAGVYLIRMTAGDHTYNHSVIVK